MTRTTATSAEQHHRQRIRIEEVREMHSRLHDDFKKRCVVCGKDKRARHYSVNLEADDGFSDVCHRCILKKELI